MSFLQELRKKKNNLKTTSTVVKTAGGDVFLEQRNSEGVVSVEKVGRNEGFVVDLKPDLQVASVLPGLFMGSQDVAQNETLLQNHGITHVLSIGIQVNQMPGFNYTFIEVLDIPEFDMKLVFERCFLLIDSVRNSGGVIFVHCNAGVSRSAAVVIAYVMKFKKLSYLEAFDVLKKERPCIKPNEGFVKQLKALEKLFV